MQGIGRTNLTEEDVKKVKSDANNESQVAESDCSEVRNQKDAAFFVGSLFDKADQAERDQIRSSESHTRPMVQDNQVPQSIEPEQGSEPWMSVVSATSSVVNKENAHDYVTHLLNEVSNWDSEKVDPPSQPRPEQDEVESVTSSVANANAAKDYVGGLFDFTTTPRREE